MNNTALHFTIDGFLEMEGVEYVQVCVCEEKGVEELHQRVWALML